MSSDLLAALMGLSDSEPVCAVAFINPPLCVFVSTSLFLSFSLFFSLVHFSNYSLTHPSFSSFSEYLIEKLKKSVIMLSQTPCIVILSMQHKRRLSHKRILTQFFSNSSLNIVKQKVLCIFKSNKRIEDFKWLMTFAIEWLQKITYCRLL